MSSHKVYAIFKISSLILVLGYYMNRNALYMNMTWISFSQEKQTNKNTLQLLQWFSINGNILFSSCHAS